jgi:membrane associated rhomboid family serine protease
MGIYDRDYYRREGPSFLRSFAEEGMMCKYLIGANVAFFVIQLITMTGLRNPFTGELMPDGWFTDALILDAPKVLEGQVWRLLTYAFLHSITWSHILFNMLFLWWFGRRMEEVYGPREFLAFYLIAAIVGGLVFTIKWQIDKAGALGLGASGSVTAVMVLFALHYPRYTIIYWFIPMPVWVMVAFQVGRDLFGFLGFSNENVGFSVHLAGAAFALIYNKMEVRFTNLLPNFRLWQRDRKARSRFRIYEDRDERPRTPVAVGAPPANADVDEQLGAKLDAVLKKFSQQGKESLTDSERQILMRASEVYKKRRS